MNILDLKSKTCDANTRLLITKYNSRDSSTSLEQDSSIVPTPMNPPTVEGVISCKPVIPSSHSDSEDEDDIPDINWNVKPVIYQINLQFLVDMEDVLQKASLLDHVEMKNKKAKLKNKEKKKPKEKKNSKKRVSLSSPDGRSSSSQKSKLSKRKKLKLEEGLQQSQI